MSVTISGNYALTLDNCRNLLAGSSVYRSLMGVTTPAQAKAMTWWSLTDDQQEYEQAQFPRAIVEYSDGYTVSRKSTTHGVSTNTVDVSIEIAVPVQYEDSLQDALKWFRSQVGLMLDQLTSLSWGGEEDSLNTPNTYVDVEKFRIEYAGRGFPEKNPDAKEYLFAMLQFECRGL